MSVGIGDNQASFFGSVKDPNRSVLANFGTGSQISLMIDCLEENLGHSEVETRPFLESSCLLSGSALCGGRAYALLERFFRQYAEVCTGKEQPQFERMNQLAVKGMKDENYMRVRTTFCGTRANPQLRGSISEIGEDNLTPESLVAGVLWGMVTELHDLFDQMPHEKIDTLVASGNAVRKNPALCQMLERVFGMQVYIPEHKEEAAYGAALFAAVASKEIAREEAGTCICYQKICN